MEWRKYYLDVILVPLGLVMIVAYHVWLWYKTQTQPFTTTFGREADSRRSWVLVMIKEIDKKNVVAIQSLRNWIMASTLMATSAILICAGLGAVISSTYTAKHAIKSTIFGADSELMVGLKYGILLAAFLFSFFCHTCCIGFLNQINILICSPQDHKSLVNSQYLTQIFDKAMLLNTLGNRILYSALSFLLWIFGPVPTFLSSMVMLVLLYNLDFHSVPNNFIHENQNT
ncbi:hypothetical protein V8G54_011320 [Vigna mungo]|uniref:DUF599 domain-containing protein n=1 Tax=Vigna mungo TaxID=3915 RepID=A0AAQ3NNX5_VIGMU